MKNTIDEVMRNLSSKKTGSSGADPQEWLKKALTKKELGHIKVKYFSKGILGINVDSSVWLYMLNLKKGELLAQGQKEFLGLKNINFRIGEVK